MNLQFDQYQSTLNEYAFKLTANARYPVPLRPICRQLVVHGIKRAKLEGCKSLLVDAKIKPVIIINSSVAGTKALNERFNRCERFLIAHELGHLVLHQNGAKSPSGPSEYWKLEELCDEFARRLLIPDQVVAGSTEKTRSSAIERLRATLELARECSVPWSAAATRLANSICGTVFIWLAPEPSGSLKVLVSTLPNRQGIGGLVKPGSHLHDFLAGESSRPAFAHSLDPQPLCGLVGIENIQSAAVYPLRDGLRLALVPA